MNAGKVPVGLGLGTGDPENLGPPRPFQRHLKDVLGRGTQLEPCEIVHGQPHHRGVKVFLRGQGVGVLQRADLEPCNGQVAAAGLFDLMNAAGDRIHKKAPF